MTIVAMAPAAIFAIDPGITYIYPHHQRPNAMLTICVARDHQIDLFGKNIGAEFSPGVGSNRTETRKDHRRWSLTGLGACEKKIKR